MSENTVLKAFEAAWPSLLDELKTLVRIPGVSFPGFPKKELERSASAVGAMLKRAGFENVEVLPFRDAHPYVYGDWLHAPGKPTLLLYAHHDVQPPGRAEMWKTPPFEPTEMDGPGGRRLYARGAADDKAGILVHAAAVGAYLKAAGKLPVNVKVIIEGEEEIGSGHLGDFLKAERKRLDADILVLTDTSNFDCGIPGLTVALRGLIDLDVEVRALSKTVHSGMWGGPVPDPAMALTKMLASLADEEGRIAVPAIRDMIQPPPQGVAEALGGLPFDEARFRDQAGLVEGVRLHRHGRSVFEQLWFQPSVNLNAVQASSRAQPNNIINDIAWARVTVRVPPGMNPEKVRDALQAHLEERVPWGLQATFASDACASGWMAEMTGKNAPAFEAAKRAMAKGYGKPAVLIGCGGTIPFVRPLAEALGGAPALLIGVEDPYTNAHGENESVLIEDLRKACVSQIHLFEELGRL